MANITSFGDDNVRPMSMNNRSMNLFSTFSLWVGANVVVTTVFTGMLLVPDMTFFTALAVILLGSLLGTIPLVLTGNIGTRTGLPTMILTRGAFGTRGALLPSAVNTIILIGWSWIQAYMAGLSLDHAVKFLTGYSNINLFTIFTEIAVVLIIIYGHRGIEATERLIATSMLVLSVIVFGYMFYKFDLGNLITMEASKSPAITVMVGFDIVVATAFSWMSSVSDFNRNCKSEKVSIIGTYFGYITATLVAMGLGATVSGFSILGNMTQTYDPTMLIGQANPALGFIAAIVIFFSVLSTNVMALYSATMSYLAMFPKHSFWIPALVMGIISTIGALLKDWLLEHFQNFLLMVGTLFIPVAAILIVDYYLLKRRNYDAAEIVSGENMTYWYTGGVNYLAYVAYIVGAGFAYFFSYIHPLVTGSTIWTFLLTSVVYWGLMKLGRVSVVAGDSKKAAV
ncbi:purine-cytosine permease family protein [Paradesulfitobacterium ferrireducens]|uniref:purine-cytosine permease family protein n=1 Tax=Paradesulfitobacterium ferrireducens TaxID=2816476 RepID=UPI001A8CE0ED|nr:cytosine permease [Paradesulfitobacterium ferrireducens]